MEKNLKFNAPVGSFETSRMSVYKDRKLSSFLAKELLLDYLDQNLDNERREALERTLQTNAEVANELQNLEYGRLFCKKLQEVEIHDSVFLEVQDLPEGLAKELLYVFKFPFWPPWLKWAFEGLAIGTLVTFFLAFMPWYKIISTLSSSAQDSVILAELAKNEEKTKLSQIEDQQIAQFKDEEVEAPKQDIAKNDKSTDLLAPLPADKLASLESSVQSSVQNVATPNVQLKLGVKGSPGQAPNQAVIMESGSSITQNVPNKEVAPRPLKTDSLAASGEPQAAAASGTPPAVTAVNGLQNSVSVDNKASVVQGVLWRGRLSVVNLAALNSRLVQTIESFGGRKAGEVELGWQRSAGERYFHFTCPTAKMDLLIKELGQFGLLDISKEKHERVMPEGISRLIIIAKENPPKEE